ncbi:MAG TPA: nucleotidyltransferase-like protein, partial [Ktedonobacteraceae bacterium]
MSQHFSAFPKRFLAALQAIERLQAYDRYLGAFIFGSLVRLEATEQSDCDVQVIVNEDNPCTNVNHPIIGGVKLDLTFLSLSQLRARTQQQMEERKRVPWIAEAFIVFDKTNRLLPLQEQAKQALPRKTSPDEFQYLQFMFYHANDKVE